MLVLETEIDEVAYLTYETCNFIYQLNLVFNSQNTGFGLLTMAVCLLWFLPRGIAFTFTVKSNFYEERPRFIMLSRAVCILQYR